MIGTIAAFGRRGGLMNTCADPAGAWIKEMAHERMQERMEELFADGGTNEFTEYG